MNQLYSWTFICLASLFFMACASSDPFLELESPDTSPLALAKPIVPGLSPPPEEPTVATDGEDIQSEPIEEPVITQEESSNDPVANSESLLPSSENIPRTPKAVAEPSSSQPTTTQTEYTPPASTEPGRRVPSSTGGDPCNEVHKAMIKSMQTEIDELQTYYEELTDIIERHGIMKEVREKKKDLQKYKQDHGCN